MRRKAKQTERKNRKGDGVGKRNVDGLPGEVFYNAPPEVKYASRVPEKGEALGYFLSRLPGFFLFRVVQQLGASSI